MPPEILEKSRWLQVILLLCVLLLSPLGGQADTAANIPALQNAALENIVKSENDDRAYRYLVLPNHLQVLLISDPTTEKSAASLDIHIGSAQDPDDRPGLAHFLEHMLFLGTQKYPAAGEYQEYINAHSGSNNAYTSLEHTNFHFDIDPAYLDPALDRFAQFFVAPLFDENYVTRERNAVHSEYAARIKEESRRSWDVMAVLVQPQNHSARFSVGTLDTLADHDTKKVRDDLLAFYQTHYSANLMALVVLGKETPDQLEQMVRLRFADVPDKNLVMPADEVPLFPAGFLPKKVYVKPLKDQRVLSLRFPIPVFEQWYHEKPLAYIAYFLGHEGAGSARALLRDKGWIESLSAGPDVSNRQSADFEIDLELTQEGYRHQDEIINIIYHSIDMLKKQGIEKWRYNEQSVINDTIFRYQEKGDALDYVSTLANNLHYYTPQEVIAGSVMMTHYDEALIHRYLDDLKPENALVEINAPDVPVTGKTTYYQTEYSVAPVTDANIERWKQPMVGESLRLPPPNEFVAKQFRVKQPEITAKTDGADVAPILLRNTPNLRLWYRQDRHFNVPRGGIYIYARSVRSVQGVAGDALTEMFVRMLDNNLNSSAYTAQLAGLDLKLSKRSRGIDIEIGGYSDKQGLLLTRVLEAMSTPAFRQKDFDSVKEGLMRELLNENSDLPYHQLSHTWRSAISRSDYQVDELAQAVDKITLLQLQMFAMNWLKTVNADVLIHGNFLESDALKLSSIIDNKLALSGALHPDPQGLFVHLPETSKGLIHAVNVNHHDVAVLHYMQGSEATVEEEARMKMLVQLMETGFYQQLRTEQQLGYIVYAGNGTLAQVPGMIFLVQSPSHAARDVDGRMSDFFAGFADILAAMPTDEFEQYRTALLKNVEEKPKNLGEEGAEYWADIANHYWKFDYREELARNIRQLDQKSLLDYYKKTFLSPAVHRLVLVTTSAVQPLDKELQEKYHVMDDINVFRKSQPYFILK
jgi:secreted Zn-dependent insulinase-like peptidase